MSIQEPLVKQSIDSNNHSCDVTAALSQYDNDNSVSKSGSESEYKHDDDIYDESGDETIEAIIKSIDIDEDDIEALSDRLLSKTAAFINLCKCFSGASLFAMPWAFGQSGLLSGSLSLIFLAFLTYFTLFWLGKCSHLVYKQYLIYILSLSA